jgi:hypothetical protein
MGRSLAAARTRPPARRSAPRCSGHHQSPGAPRLGLGWAFYNRIVSAAGRKPVDVNRVLARVIAHEVGHLILPVHGHGEFGIMRSALGLDHVGIYRFTNDQARQMRAALTERRVP